MYLACRHIKPNGVRCKSPALRGGAFCYFHARIHDTTRLSVMDDVKIPLIEDSASVQLAIQQIFDALLSSRIDSKRAGQLLYGLQIAVQTVPRKWVPALQSVESVTRTKDGNDLAPELRVCLGGEDCTQCPYRDTCDDYDPNDDDDDDDD